MRDVFITGAARTPMGGFQGIFSDVDAPHLGWCGDQGRACRCGASHMWTRC